MSYSRGLPYIIADRIVIDMMRELEAVAHTIRYEKQDPGLYIQYESEPLGVVTMSEIIESRAPWTAGVYASRGFSLSEK